MSSAPVLMDTLPQSEAEFFEAEQKKFFIKSIKIISTIQLISAFVAAITEMVIISNQWNYSVIGVGIWSGFFFALSGLIGLLTAQKPSKRKYVEGE